MEGKFDPRNKLNDLTGKEWLKLTKSFMFSESCSDDKDAFLHPAPFLIKDVEKLISMFTKKDMVVLDPFIGSGTTAIAANNIGRKCIGIDLSEEYRLLALTRFEKKGMQAPLDYEYILGDSIIEVDALEPVDFVITSPPYHNILRNTANGIRKDNSHKGYRSGSRIGTEYYSDSDNDLGNQKSFEDYLSLLLRVMSGCYKILKNKHYCVIISSDYTVNRKEICVQGQIVQSLISIGFEFSGTIALLQDKKPLYPFAYPYEFKINHMHQNIMIFRKVIKDDC